MSNYPNGAENDSLAPYNAPDHVESWPSSLDFEEAAQDLCDCPEMLALTGELGMDDMKVLATYKEYRAKLFERACKIMEAKNDQA
jgi:hypothetical protein